MKHVRQGRKKKIDVRICTEEAIGLITAEEWEQTLQNSNNWKASGLNSVPADVTRYAGLFLS